MSATSLLVSAGFGAVSAAAYGVVGAVLLRREASHTAKRAQRAFALWWMGAAFVFLLGAETNLAAALGNVHPEFHHAVRTTSIFASFAAIGGLVAYFVHIVTGKPWAVRGAAVAYAIGGVAIGAVYAREGAGGVKVGTWIAESQVRETLPPLVVAAILIFVYLPPLAGSIFYLSIIRKMEDPLARRRMRLVASSLALFFAASVVARAFESDTGIFVARNLLSSVSALAALAAYAPPLSRRA